MNFDQTIATNSSLLEILAPALFAAVASAPNEQFDVSGRRRRRRLRMEPSNFSDPKEGGSFVWNCT